VFRNANPTQVWTMVVSNIKLYRWPNAIMEIKPGAHYGTFIAPFDATLPEGVTAFLVTGKEDKSHEYKLPTTGETFYFTKLKTHQDWDKIVYQGKNGTIVTRRGSLKYEGGDKNRKDREAKTVNVGEHFHMALRAAANDCEKLNNNVFVEYAEYFKDWCGKDNIKTPDIIAAINKLEDLTRVKELQFIERPVEAEVLDKMLARTNDYVSSVVNASVNGIVNMDGVKADSIKAEELGGVIMTLNYATDLYSLVGNLTSDASRSYSDDVRERYRNLRQYFLKSIALQKSLLAQVRRGLPAVYEALPPLKVLTNH
jgi:hypothetical protein